MAVVPALGLAGCMCDANGNLAMMTPVSITTNDRCQTAVNKLQSQDEYLKTVVFSTAKTEQRMEAARIVQNNLRILVEPVPGYCPDSIIMSLVPEVNQRIGQIDKFIASGGVWEGPVG